MIGNNEEKANVGAPANDNEIRNKKSEFLPIRRLIQVRRKLGTGPWKILGTGQIWFHNVGPPGALPTLFILDHGQNNKVVLQSLIEKDKIYTKLVDNHVLYWHEDYNSEVSLIFESEEWCDQVYVALSQTIGLPADTPEDLDQLFRELTGMDPERFKPEMMKRLEAEQRQRRNQTQNGTTDHSETGNKSSQTNDALTKGPDTSAIRLSSPIFDPTSSGQAEPEKARNSSDDPPLPAIPDSERSFALSVKRYFDDNVSGKSTKSDLSASSLANTLSTCSVDTQKAVQLLDMNLEGTFQRREQSSGGEPEILEMPPIDDEKLNKTEDITITRSAINMDNKPESSVVSNIEPPLVVISDDDSDSLSSSTPVKEDAEFESESKKLCENLNESQGSGLEEESDDQCDIREIEHITPDKSDFGGREDEDEMKSPELGFSVQQGAKVFESANKERQVSSSFSPMPQILQERQSTSISVIEDTYTKSNSEPSDDPLGQGGNYEKNDANNLTDNNIITPESDQGLESWQTPTFAEMSEVPKRELRSSVRKLSTVSDDRKNKVEEKSLHKYDSSKIETDGRVAIKSNSIKKTNTAVSSTSKVFDHRTPISGADFVPKIHSCLRKMMIGTETRKFVWRCNPCGRRSKVTDPQLLDILTNNPGNVRHLLSPHSAFFQHVFSKKVATSETLTPRETTKNRLIPRMTSKGNFAAKKKVRLILMSGSAMKKTIPKSVMKEDQKDLEPKSLREMYKLQCEMISASDIITHFHYIIEDQQDIDDQQEQQLLEEFDLYSKVKSRNRKKSSGPPKSESFGEESSKEKWNLDSGQPTSSKAKDTREQAIQKCELNSTEKYEEVAFCPTMKNRDISRAVEALSTEMSVIIMPKERHSNVGRTLKTLIKSEPKDFSDNSSIDSGRSSGSFLSSPICPKRGPANPRREPKVQCEKCGVLLADNRSLKRHDSAVHKGQKPFSCKNCHRKYSDASNCWRHEKRCREEARTSSSST